VWTVGLRECDFSSPPRHHSILQAPSLIPPLSWPGALTYAHVQRKINAILIRIGRPPIQMGLPNVPKMPREMVNRIPLVLYIPMPELSNSAGEGPLESSTAKQSEHVYPPGHPKAKFRRGFFFKKSQNTKRKGPTIEQDVEAEAGWQKGEYPFVKLEANQATCAICYLDFEPPQRIGEELGRNEPDEAEPLRLLGCGHVFHVSISRLSLRWVC
jgi:hypothetical protein